MLLLLAAVLGSVGAVVPGERLTRGIETAICRLVGGPCPAGTTAAPPPARPPDDQCVTRSGIDQRTEGRKVLVVGDEQVSTRQEDVLGDGSLSITTADQSSQGIDLELGLGVQWNGLGIGASAGGGVMWTGSDQYQFRFADRREADAFYREAHRRVEDHFDEHGFGAVFDGGLAEIPLRLAEQRGIPYTYINADGRSAFVQGQATVGMGNDTGEVGLGGGGEYREVRLLGTSESVDAQGNRTTGQYYEATNTLTRELFGGVRLNDVGGPGDVGDWTSDETNIYHVEYDRNGAPIRVTAVQTTQWVFGGGGTLEVRPGLGPDDGVNPEGGGGVTTSLRIQDGDTTVATTTVEIPPELRADVRNELDGLTDHNLGDRLRGLDTLRRLARGEGATFTLQEYGFEGRQTQGGLDLDYGIEIVDWGNEHQEATLELESAQYRDPESGELVPWVTCTGT
ncbi:hypothetical protein DPM19_05820 [Actinomadura craniellae]|uniref:Uncharacterized protein n=1 Tax=Actinomadura craniellae TaxID=2231787 RepID=A0A365HBJ9_9ACTN|nr:hypothetical protein DPM19_05820 [Actinomadura craniellae]